MSRVNLFYTRGSLQAAHLHPARTHDAKSKTVRETENTLKSYLTQNINRIIGRITCFCSFFLSVAPVVKKDIDPTAEKSH